MREQRDEQVDDEAGEPEATAADRDPRRRVARGRGRDGLSTYEGVEPGSLSKPHPGVCRGLERF